MDITVYLAHDRSEESSYRHSTTIHTTLSASIIHLTNVSYLEWMQNCDPPKGVTIYEDGGWNYIEHVQSLLTKDMSVDFTTYGGEGGLYIETQVITVPQDQIDAHNST